METTAIDTSIFTKCAKLQEDSRGNRTQWERLRDMLESGPKMSPLKNDTANSDLKRKNKQLTSRVEELEAEVERLQTKNRGSSSTEQDRLDKERRNIQKDAEKLKEYNTKLEKAKHVLEKREAEIRKRESEMKDTIDFFQVQLAPTEQKARQGRTTPPKNTARDASYVPDTVRRCQLSRARVGSESRRENRRGRSKTKRHRTRSQSSDSSNSDKKEKRKKR